MVWRILIVISFLFSPFAFAEEGTIRLRRIKPAPAKKMSPAMQMQKEMGARIKLQDEYYSKVTQLDKGEKRREQLKADLEFARIADPDRIPGIKREIKLQEIFNVKLQREVHRLHAELTKSLKRSPASVGKPVRRK